MFIDGAVNFFNVKDLCKIYDGKLLECSKTDKDFLNLKLNNSVNLNGDDVVYVVYLPNPNFCRVGRTVNPTSRFNAHMKFYSSDIIIQAVLCLRGCEFAASMLEAFIHIWLDRFRVGLCEEFELSEQKIKALNVIFKSLAAKEIMDIKEFYALLIKLFRVNKLNLKLRKRNDKTRPALFNIQKELAKYDIELSY